MHRHLFVLVLLWMSWSGTAQTEELTIATGDGRPYIFTDELTISESKPGFSIEIVRAVSAKLGWKVNFVVLPFSRQLFDTKVGKVDAMMALFHSDAPSFVFPDQPIAIARNCFYKRSESDFRFSGVESLNAIKFGVANGYTYGVIDEYVLQNGLNNVVTISGEDKSVAERLIAMLASSRVDAIIEAENVIDYHLQEKKIKGIVNAGCTPELEAFLGFSPAIKNSRERAQKFDSAINALRESGEIDKILGRYNATDWR